MFKNISTSLNEAAKVATLATASFLPLPSSQASEPPTNAAQAKTNQASSRSNLTIPDDVKLEAEKRKIPLSAIKFENEQWIACISRPGQPDSCIVLRDNTKESSPATSAPMLVDRLVQLKNGDTLVINQYGEPAKEHLISLSSNTTKSSIPEIGELNREKDFSYSFSLHKDVAARVVLKRSGNLERSQYIDTLPQLKKESDYLVRTKDLEVVNSSLAKHPDEEFMVIVTVPALCPPCRSLDKVIKDLYSDKAKENPRVKTFILEYFDFETAQKEVLGEKAQFPSIFTFRRHNSEEKIPTQVVGNKLEQTDEQILKPIEQNIQRPGSPRHFVRGGLARDGIEKLIEALRN